MHTVYYSFSSPSFLRSFDGEQLNGERLRLGFARPAPSKCVWCCGLPTKRDLSASVGSDVVVKAVQGEFGRFGKIQDVLYDEERGHALVYYDQVRQIGKLFTCGEAEQVLQSSDFLLSS